MTDPNARRCPTCGNVLREQPEPSPMSPDAGVVCDIYLCTWVCDCCRDAERRAKLNERSGL